MSLPHLPTLARVRVLALDAKKALGLLATIEASAVGFGLLDSATAGVVTAALGVVGAGVVYVLENIPKP